MAVAFFLREGALKTLPTNKSHKPSRSQAYFQAASALVVPPVFTSSMFQIHGGPQPQHCRPQWQSPLTAAFPIKPPTPTAHGHHPVPRAWFRVPNTLCGSTKHRGSTVFSRSERGLCQWQCWGLLLVLTRVRALLSSRHCQLWWVVAGLRTETGALEVL